SMNGFPCIARSSRTFVALASFIAADLSQPAVYFACDALVPIHRLAAAAGCMPLGRQRRRFRFWSKSAAGSADRAPAWGAPEQSTHARGIVFHHGLAWIARRQRPRQGVIGPGLHSKVLSRHLPALL